MRNKHREREREREKVHNNDVDKHKREREVTSIQQPQNCAADGTPVKHQ